MNTSEQTPIIMERQENESYDPKSLNRTLLYIVSYLSLFLLLLSVNIPVSLSFFLFTTSLSILLQRSPTLVKEHWFQIASHIHLLIAISLYFYFIQDAINAGEFFRDLGIALTIGFFTPPLLLSFTLVWVIWDEAEEQKTNVQYLYSPQLIKADHNLNKSNVTYMMV